MPFAFDDLFESDHKNFEEAKRALKKIDPTSLTTADECASLLQRIGESFGNVCQYDQLHEVLNIWLGKQSLPAEEAAKLLENAVLVGKDLSGDDTRKAKDALLKLHSIIGRTYLLRAVVK